MSHYDYFKWHKVFLKWIWSIFKPKPPIVLPYGTLHSEDNTEGWEPEGWDGKHESIDLEMYRISIKVRLRYKISRRYYDACNEYALKHIIKKTT